MKVQIKISFIPQVDYPQPSVDGSFKAFASIMFAFAGASTFPTIQADMKTKSNFPKSVKIACVSKLTTDF
jgi:vesicular inhibitory amino acid transporter